MANTNVFRGSDGAIMLAVDAGPEGDVAKGVIDAYALTPVGRATNVEVRVDSDLRPFNELGQTTKMRSRMEHQRPQRTAA